MVVSWEYRTQISTEAASAILKVDKHIRRNVDDVTWINWYSGNAGPELGTPPYVERHPPQLDKSELKLLRLRLVQQLLAQGKSVSAEELAKCGVPCAELENRLPQQPVGPISAVLRQCMRLVQPLKNHFFHDDFK